MFNTKWAIALLLAVVGAAPLAAQDGTVMGRVLNATTNEPLPGAQVFVVGTSRGALANQDGRFMIQQVPAGQQELRAALIGFSTQTVRVTVPAGGTVTQDFTLAESAIELGAVVVSATGQAQTKREIGSSVGVINVEEVELAPVSTFSDLIQGRTAGATVMQSSGTTGAGSRIRIRGSNSISLSNSPLLVIDGVRVSSDANNLGFGVGGQQPSRLDDLNPEDIESIDILKGPAAAALYGTAAANGVIQVTTKRGRAGQPQFRAWAEYGTLENSVEFPTNVQAYDESDPDDPVLCPLYLQSLDLCTPTNTYSHNPLEDAATTPFNGGIREVVGGSVSGGGEDGTFYLSAENMNEDGVYTSDNVLRRVTVQANATGNVGPRLSVRANIGFIESDLQMPVADNALFGILGMGLFGDADPASVEATGGYENDPAFHHDWQTWQDQSRFTGSAGADWRPLSWLSFNGTAGLERITREEENRIPRVSAYSIFGSIYSEGWIQIYDYDIYNLNTNASGTAVHDLTPDLVSTTTLGTQYIREDFHRIYAFGATLIPGVETSLAGATTDYSTGESNVLNATLSAYGQQQFAWRDRVFLNTALRGDQNTAFGTDIGWIWYPSVSGSWVISDEAFFPRTDLLSELRLRAAMGQAGLRPGATDAIQSFSGEVGVFGNVDVPAIVIEDLGNPDLKPERSTEYEVGFESGLAGGRFGLELTYFHKTSEDALVNRPLPTSPGGSDSRWENLGEVKNAGVEFLLNGQALATQDFDWNFGISGSFIDNELVDLGEDAQGNPIPPIGSGTQRFVEGYPLGAWFDEPILSYEDADGDGFIDPDEIEVGDDVEFIGSAFPTREISFNTDLTLFRYARLSALLDYKGGHKMLNYTRAWRCSFELNCAATFDQNTPLEEQAAILGLAAGGTYWGFYEDADFVKFRELALTLIAPVEWAGRVGADGLRLTLAGRNLATWTGYSGLDPEVSWAGQANFTSGDFATLPPYRTFTLRVDADF